MAFQAVPNAAQVIIETGNDAYSISNSFWFTKSGFTTEEMSALAVAVFDAYKVDQDTLTESVFYIRKVTAYDQRTDGAPVVVPTVTPEQGKAATEAVPMQVTLVITLRTGTRGRSGRGRVYLGGYGIAAMSGVVFETATATAALAAIQSIKDAAEALGWTMVVVSRYHENVKRTTAVTYAVTDIECRNLVPGSQDRRTKRP